jgi:hypothetical protein
LSLHDNSSNDDESIDDDIQVKSSNVFDKIKKKNLDRFCH